MTIFLIGLVSQSALQTISFTDAVIGKPTQQTQLKVTSFLPSRYIYNFWLQKPITSTDSTNNLKRLPKKTFLQQYKGIVDENLITKQSS